MLARRQRRAHQFAVRIVRRGHQHEVDLLIAQKIVQLVVSAQASFPRGGHARGVDIVGRDDFDPFHPGRVVQVPFAHVPKADNTQLNAHFHFLPPGRDGPGNMRLCTLIIAIMVRFCKKENAQIHGFFARQGEEPQEKYTLRRKSGIKGNDADGHIHFNMEPWKRAVSRTNHTILLRRLSFHLERFAKACLLFQPSL